MKKSLALLLLLALCTLCFSGCHLWGYYDYGSQNKRYYRDPAFDPVITQADFPFELSCLIDGERFDIKGVYVGEYLGLCKIRGMGPVRFWKATIFDENGQVLSHEEKFPVAEYGDWTIYCSLFPIEHMMNDKEALVWHVPNQPLSETELFSAKHTNGNWMYHNEVLFCFPVELLSCDIAPPIDNAFPQSK